MTWTPRLRTVFLAVAAVILLIPAGGVVFLRLYESVLVRRTEAELIAQGALVAAAFAAELERAAPLEARVLHGAAPGLPDEPFTPRFPKLNLSRDPVLPPSPPARPTTGIAGPGAATAGASLSPVLVVAQRTTLTGIRVTDASGLVVASSGAELGLSLDHREEIRRALKGEEVSVLRERAAPTPLPTVDSISRNNRVRVWVAVPVRQGDRIVGAVLLSRTPTSVLQSLYSIRGPLAVAVALMLALATLVSLATSRLITRPIRELIARTDQVASGEREMTEPLASPGTLEVLHLSRSLSLMSRTLRERALYIQAFAAHVSHEFKTPLTALRGGVELLREHWPGMTTEERERFLVQIDRDSDRMERLVGRLLELARADTARPSGERADVRAVVAGLPGLAVGRVAVFMDEGLPTVLCSAEVLESVLGNLVDNALRHGGPDVGVTLRARGGAGSGVELLVEDDGPGISEANARSIFEPFFTTARETGGTGLGLSIVRALVHAHGGTVTCDSRPGATRFTVRLPA